jgi:hypothetical protein
MYVFQDSWTSEPLKTAVKTMKLAHMPSSHSDKREIVMHSKSRNSTNNALPLLI